MDLKSIFGAVKTALGAIKTATNLPLVKLLPYVGTVESAVDVIDFALEKGENIAGFVSKFTDTFANGLPSEDKRVALDVDIAALRAKLHAPLPAPEEGEEA